MPGRLKWIAACGPVLAMACLCISAFWLMYGESIELELMKREVANIPGLTFVGVRDFGAPGEPDPELVLLVEGKGMLVLYEPDLSSFTGDGSIVVSGIGHCAKTANLVLTSGRNHHVHGLSFSTVKELIASYDAVYQYVLANGYCVR